MSTITLPNIRVGSDLQVRARLKDGGVAIDWSTLQNIKACIYSDAQRALAGRCAFSIDEEDNTLLVCTYAANKPQYLGVNRIVISAKYMGETKTYDKPAFAFVRWTADQEGEEITIDDPDVDVEIDVEDISSSILQEAVDAAFTAADRANDAAAAAEHMVDIHTGPEGKSAYEVAVEEGYTGTEEEWLASLKGDTGETPDISIGTVTTVAPGTPASASMTGTPEEPVLNLSIPQGVVGATPNFTVGTVTTGEPGSSVIVTITGTPEAPVLNLTIPQGMQGNTGSSVEFPYELVNNLTTNDATKGLSAAQGYVLDGKVSQLEAEVTEFESDVNGRAFLKKLVWTNGYITNTGTINNSSASKFSQPFVLKKGQKVTIGTANSSITIIGTTNATSLAVGDSVTPLQTTGYPETFETHTYTATEDTIIVLCVRWANHTLSFQQTETMSMEIDNIKDRLDAVEDAVTFGEWVEQDSTSGPYKPTNQNSGNNGARIENGWIYAASSGNALATDKIEIVPGKRYKLRTRIGNYFDGVAYYNGNIFVGYDVFHTTGEDETIEAELTIPSNATHFRFASKDVTIAYAVYIYEEQIAEVVTRPEFEAVEEDVEQAKEDIQYLYGVAESQGAIDTANAVKVLPTKNLYLGADILSLVGNTYDPTYWEIIDGTIKYLGGGGESTPFVFSATTEEGKRYLAEITAHVSDGIYTNLFCIQIGDGFLVDTYDGTQNTRGGLLSDGGLFKIVPLSTRAFEMSSVKLSEVLQSEESAGYERTLQINISNVSAGNSAQTLIDGKWNVAVGPASSTMANNIGGTRSIAIGVDALHNFQFGGQNVAIGTFSASQLLEGNYNIVIGSDAMWQSRKATANIVIGRSALGNTGEYSEMLRNIAIGKSAMGVQQSSTKDSVAIGYEANLYGCSNSVFIGNHCTTTYSNRAISNVICIGYFGRATKSNQIVIGTATHTEVVIAGKKLVFNNDNTVSWETIS